MWNGSTKGTTPKVGSNAPPPRWTAHSTVMAAPYPVGKEAVGENVEDEEAMDVEVSTSSSKKTLTTKKMCELKALGERQRSSEESSC